MKVLLQGYNSEGFLTARVRNNWLIAAHTQRRKPSVVIRDTVGVVIVISDEWRALQCAATGSAAETVSMETLAHCFQHAICDPLSTARTNCQRVHIALLTLWRSITVIKLHSLQGALAGYTAETVRVEKFVHCPDCRLRPGESLSTLSTHLCRRRGDNWGTVVHVFNEIFGHPFKLFNFSH